MEVWGILQIYLLVAIALAGTSYFNLYRPGIQLLEEIIDQKTVYSTFWCALVWLVIALIMAPFIAIVLLVNDNNEFIHSLALKLASRFEEEEE
jgi:Trk-type K+ transport system membrane component